LLAEHGPEGLVHAQDQALVAENQITVGDAVQNMLGGDGLNVQQMQLIDVVAVKKQCGDEAQGRGGDGHIHQSQRGDNAHNQRCQHAQDIQHTLLDV